jgi:protein involved in polysaccharide export with SLBB domain
MTTNRPPPNSEAALAANEPFFARLLTERDTLTVALARQQAVLGENSPVVAKLHESLKTLNERIMGIGNQLAKSGAGAAKTGPYYLSGAIARPGVYNLGGDRVSVLQALIAAGHSAPQSAGVHIIRRWPDPEKEERLAVEANLTSGKGVDVEVRPGDTIVVGPMTDDITATTRPTTAP